MSATILIADDDPVQRRLIEAMARRFGYRAETVDGGAAALARIEARDPCPIDLLILDLVMPDLDGMAVLARLRERRSTVPVIVQTAHGSIDAVVSAVRAGAVDFVVKPVGAERLQVSIKNALRLDALGDELRRAKRRGEGRVGFDDLASRSEDMARVVRLAERASKSAIPVLIEGESGVGKELMARAIRAAGDRKARPFVAVNCGALPENLVESILFGHEKGAFTGAVERHSGKFLDANGGTLFLDEVGELPPNAQVKLLRALQEGEIDPVGAKRPVRVDVRVISATNRDLLSLVKAGSFREDLFYRLNVYPLSVPPLRARRDDVIDLARRFAARFAAEEGKPVRGLSSEAAELLRRYDWPGNVRQLENALFRAVVLADGDELGIAEFPQVAAQVEGFDVRVPPVAASAALSAPLREPAPYPAAPEPGALSLLDETGDLRPLESIEEEAIRFALAHCRGRMSEMARKLKIGRSTLYRKLREFGIGDGEAAA
ncbi:MAG: sigma-54-dependent Fis family transcriptional regulator [Hyphomicrobiales bacterium]|nr:sigma-54 dependent transcriptional regulator [Hyphomicrobiales bacterium]MDE2018178.1 sigma-54-dependent Fis family transcriptional regulator [Hyphomicrobiales bacterium]